LEVTGLGYAPVGKIISGDKEISIDGNKGLETLLTAASLCSNARFGCSE